MLPAGACALPLLDTGPLPPTHPPRSHILTQRLPSTPRWGASAGMPGRTLVPAPVVAAGSPAMAAVRVGRLAAGGLRCVMVKDEFAQSACPSNRLFSQESCWEGGCAMAPMKDMKKYLLLMKKYRQEKKFINNIMKKQTKKKKTKKQPAPRKYKGVFWSSTRGVWFAQKTYPEGHKPRQEYLGCHKDQRKCAELLTSQKCSLEDLLLDRSAPEGNMPQLYKGVFFRKKKKRWQAQVTHPPGHRPRQEVVGTNFRSQKAAAEALAEHLNVTVQSLRLRKEVFYSGSLAKKKALKNFKVLQNMFVKKNMIPGKIFHGWVGILEFGGSQLLL